MSGSGGERATDEDPGVANPENNGDNDVPNISDAETEPAMLEEEEMPTYMSLTSSSRPDESRAEPELQQLSEKDNRRDQGNGNGASSPCASDGQGGGGSIYVVSSGEETERPYDDEDYESDEMDVDEEEEEEDEDDSRPGYDDEEDSDCDIEPEQFERSSDDFVLRYDTNLEKHHKARSRSLQDLTNSRGNLSRFVGKRRSVDIMGQYNTELRRQERDPLGDEKKPLRTSRYADVPSKVKLYIQSIKEQSRRSAELKNRENPLYKNSKQSKIEIPDVSCTIINPANRIIKGYAQNLINSIMEQDNSITPDVTYAGRRLNENEPKIESIVAPESKQFNDKARELENALIPDNQTNTANNPIKIAKSNGIIDYITQNNSEKIIESTETIATNGKDQLTTIFDLRTLSYEEYVNGDEVTNKEDKIDEIIRPIVEKNGVTELMEENEILGLTEIQTAQIPASLKTENVVSNSTPQEAHSVRETSEFPKSMSHDTNSPNPDVTMLWAMLNQKSLQLNEKTAQYDGIRDAFQKTLTENISLKRELEELKKTLKEYREENKPRETKVVSVQTEVILEREESKISPDESKPKLLSSSIASALSSIEEWSDSNCSPAISINPPNMDHVLNSDDSLNLPNRTPRRQARPLSHSFVTSSRILQTLANITQGRTKTTSPMANATRNVNTRLETEQGQSKPEFDNPLVSGNETNAPRAKKRKASDMLGISSPSELFKIPYTNEMLRKKINSDSDTDGVFKSPREKTRTGNNEPTPGGSKDSEKTDGQEDFEDTEATDVPENVKCFVYREEADSKERSFLIQAEEPSKNSDVGEKGGGTVRECGPYLLGNVEIRMSEANGTINIWGKEISEESEDVDVEEMEESAPYENPSLSRRSSLDNQRTPRDKLINYNSPIVCSTNKKSKNASQFVRSSIGKYFRPALSNLAKFNAVTSEGATGRYSSSPNLNDRTISCEQCDSRKKRNFQWPSCDHMSNSRRKQHSCCCKEVEINERECREALDDNNDDDEVILETMTNILSNHNKCTTALHNISTKNSCANHRNEETCRHQNWQNRRSPEHEEDCHYARKRCASCAADLPSCNTRLTPGSGGCCDKKSRSHSRAFSCDDDEHPLLQNRQHYETPETKRRRLSGKKVRGILTELLRGCSGCRNNTSFVPHESASLPNINPAIRVTPCTPPVQPSCSKSSATCATHSKHQPSRDHSNEKCCSSCSRRVEMAAEIESKLELLTIEMERLRSRSDTFRGMLNLLNADTD